MRSKCPAGKAVRPGLAVGGKPDDSALAPGALVFTPSAGPVPLNDLSAWWRWVHGANWRHPRQYQRDADSGLTLLIQNESLGKDKETNWLPAPKGPLMAMRLFWPKDEATEGKWTAPPLQQAKK